MARQILAAFVAVAREQSFTRASALLVLSQPPPIPSGAEAYDKMMRNEARFRMVLTTRL